MEAPWNLAIDFSIIALILIGIRQFRSPRGALRGNAIAAAALALAIAAVAVRHRVVSPVPVVVLLLVGGSIGSWLALRVSMIQTPAMVALQHGAGAVAAFLVCVIELVRGDGAAGAVHDLSGLTGLALGGATFSASLIASGKLANLLKQPPQQIPGHGAWLSASVAAILALAVFAGRSGGSALVWFLLLLLAVSALAGLLVALRVGGADMPVLISFLNASAGLAAAFAGVVIGNRLLVAAGATVAASGSVLTVAMCRAMNRSLLAVLRGFHPVAAAVAPGLPTTLAPAAPIGDDEAGLDPIARAVQACLSASSIIVIPGYGMAMAQAQFEVVELARRLESADRRVRFAIHPVAGRMPGHMHVLLSEAEAPWEQLFEMPQINDDFATTDLAVIVGASDVVNPAAVTLPDTPISGMPILKAQEAGRIIIVNLDDRPGYSGVRNLLYDRPGVILLWGDAKQSLRALIDALAAAQEPGEVPGVPVLHA